MRNRIALTCLLAALSAGGAPAFAAAAPSALVRQAEETAPGARITVTRDGDRWTADYVLSQDAPVWAFYRSTVTNGTREPWRPRDWRVVTPGVVLERVGDLDVLRTMDGGPVPREVSLRLTPSGENLEADYPVLMFTDGSVAMPTGAFDVFPLPSLEAVQLSDDERGAYRRSVGNAWITWRDSAGPVLHHGRRQAQAEGDDGRTYVLFGQTEVKAAERLVTVVDPELPSWIAASIEGFAPRVADYYATRLGAGQTDRPTIMATWYGPTAGTTNYGGSVLPGLIVMTFEGKELLASSDAVLAENRWFIGHESAHFWLGQTVRAERARESWMTEGGADLMAVRAMKALDPGFDERSVLQAEVDDCARLAVRPVIEAGQRGEHRAWYSCGAVFALAAEAAQKKATGGDWFDFLKPLIDAGRADGVLTREAWLSRLTEVSGDPTLRTDIETLLTAGAADPAAVIARLFDRTGVAYRLVDGKIALG